VIGEWRLLTRYYGDIIRAELEGGKGTGEIVEMLFDRFERQSQAKKFSQQTIRAMLMSVVLGYYQYFRQAGIID
jgi:hypothetical protein